MRAGGWDNGATATSYLLRLPRQYMKVLTSFSSTVSSYFLKHAAVPWSGFFDRPGPWWTSPPGRTQEVRSVLLISLAGSFIGLLKELRLIFLQDAAILQPISRTCRSGDCLSSEIPNGMPLRKPFATVKRRKKSPPTCG